MARELVVSLVIVSIFEVSGEHAEDFELHQLSLVARSRPYEIGRAVIDCHSDVGLIVWDGVDFNGFSFYCVIWHASSPVRI